MTGAARTPLIVASALAGLLLAAAPGRAQAPGLNLDQQGGGAPIEITARNGIEWDRERNRYIASGDARAARGDTAVTADRLIAHYRERPGQSTQIYRYEAAGNVRITTATQSAVADLAVYDIDSGVMVLTGRNLRLTTPNEVLTARDSLEYWTERHLAVARGDATVLTREERRMRADVLAVYLLAPGEQLPARPAPRAGAAQAPFLPVPGEDNRVKRVEAFGNVFIAAAPSIARGERAVYNAATRLATISGNVKLTHCDNQLDGEVAEVNMDTGMSRMMPRSDGGRVRALLMPGQGPQQGAQQGQAQGSDQCRRAGPAPAGAPAAAPAGERRR
jgi:lipopolysaccharide export system protein LptA